MAKLTLKDNGKLLLKDKSVKFAMGCNCCSTSGYWAFGYNLGSSDLLSARPDSLQQFPDKVLTQVIYSVSGVPNVWTRAFEGTGDVRSYAAASGLSSFNRTYVVPVYVSASQPGESCFKQVSAFSIRRRWNPFFIHSAPVFKGPATLFNFGDSRYCPGEHDARIGMCNGTNYPFEPVACCLTDFPSDYRYTCWGECGPFRFSQESGTWIGPVSNPVGKAGLCIGNPYVGTDPEVDYDPRQNSSVWWFATADFTGDPLGVRTTTLQLNTATPRPFQDPSVCKECKDGDLPTLTPWTLTYTCTPVWSDPPTS
jgi:hypothetical protein